MKLKTPDRIVAYIKSRGQVTASDLADYLGISRQAVHRQANKLQEQGRVYKAGKPPKVYYFIAEGKYKEAVTIVPDALKKVIEENFLNITPSGEKQEGFQGFVGWCKKRKESLEKTASEYVQTLQKYNAYRKNGLIDGMYKMKSTFSEVAVNKLFYLDFYSIERFGKTKLGQLLLYAKQSQSKGLIKELVHTIRPQVEWLATKYKVTAVGFIPPTVKREVQLMRELEKQLHLSLPKVSLVKIKTEVTVPQKTLNKLDDRVENARRTIVVDEKKKFRKNGDRPRFLLAHFGREVFLGSSCGWWSNCSRKYFGYHYSKIDSLVFTKSL